MIPDGLFTSELALAAGVAVAAGITRGFAGMGSGAIMMPLMSVLFGPLEAVIIVCLLDGWGSVQMFPWAMRRTEWRKVVYLAVGSALLMPLGALVLITFDKDIMRRVIGVMVIASTLFLMTGWRYSGPTHPAVSLGVGGLAGVLAGGTGLGGPPVIVYLLATSAGLERFRANIVSYFLLLVLFIIVTFAINGAVGPLTLWRSALLLPVFLGAMWAGSQLYRLADEHIFRAIAYALMMLSGIAAVAY